MRSVHRVSNVQPCLQTVTVIVTYVLSICYIHDSTCCQYCNPQNIRKQEGI